MTGTTELRTEEILRNVSDEAFTYARATAEIALANQPTQSTDFVITLTLRRADLVALIAQVYEDGMSRKGRLA